MTTPFDFTKSTIRSVESANRASAFSGLVRDIWSLPPLQSPTIQPAVQQRAATIESYCRQARDRGPTWRVAVSKIKVRQDPDTLQFHQSYDVQLIETGAMPAGEGPWTIYGPWPSETMETTMTDELPTGPMFDRIAAAIGDDQADAAIRAAIPTPVLKQLYAAHGAIAGEPIGDEFAAELGRRNEDV